MMDKYKFFKEFSGKEAIDGSNCREYNYIKNLTDINIINIIETTIIN